MANAIPKDTDTQNTHTNTENIETYTTNTHAGPQNIHTDLQKISNTDAKKASHIICPLIEEITTNNMESLVTKELKKEDDTNKQYFINCETKMKDSNNEDNNSALLNIQDEIIGDFNKQGVINNNTNIQLIELFQNIRKQVKESKFRPTAPTGSLNDLENMDKNQQTFINTEIERRYIRDSSIPIKIHPIGKDIETSFVHSAVKQIKNNIGNANIFFNTEKKALLENKGTFEKCNISKYTDEGTELHIKTNIMNESDTQSVKDNTEEVKKNRSEKDHINGDHTDKVITNTLVKEENINKKRKIQKQDPTKEYMEYECTLRPNEQQNIEINQIKAQKKQEDYDLDCDLFDNTNIQEENKLVKTEIEFDKFYVYAKSKNIKNPQYLPGKYKLYFEIFDGNKTEKRDISNRKKCRFLINEIMLMNPKKDEFFKFLNDVDLITLSEMETFYREEIATCLIHLCYFIYFYRNYLTRIQQISSVVQPVTDKFGHMNTSPYNLSMQHMLNNNTSNQEDLKIQQVNIYESIKEIDFDFGLTSYESIFTNYNLKDCDISKFPNLLRLLNKIITFAKEKSILKSCLDSVKTAKYKTEKGLRGIVASNILTTFLPGGDYKKLRLLIYKYDDECNGSEFNEKKFKEEIMNNFSQKNHAKQ